jgi:hypothetical protein
MKEKNKNLSRPFRFLVEIYLTLTGQCLELGQRK